ncbi:serine/threonine-protein phosphatase 6 regulatory subunit 2 isoform X3 [Arapaima gigas]
MSRLCSPICVRSSESGPRCSSPVDPENSDSDGRPKQNQDKSAKGSSPCAWNVCVARKAPLVASDSSSSGGSDSEEEEEDKGDVVTETITTGAGKETVKLTVDAKQEKAVFTSSDADSLPVGKLAVTDGPQRAPDSFPRTEGTGESRSATATDSTVTDRKEEAPLSPEAALNGPA